MAPRVNGLSLSKLRPYGATYLIFSDYAREPIRLSALMEIPAIWIFTHDSIGLGEDGPDAPAGRAARVAAGDAGARHDPALRRQRGGGGVARADEAPPLAGRARADAPGGADRSTASRYAPAAGLERGAYVLADPEDGEPELILIGTGSEVQLCVDAYEQLTAEGEKVRVVSMPSWELFDQQPPRVQGRGAARRRDRARLGRAGVDARLGALRRARDGAMIGMHTFGASAPLKDVQRKFGFTPEAIVATCRQQLEAHRRAEAR